MTHWHIGTRGSVHSDNRHLRQPPRSYRPEHAAAALLSCREALGPWPDGIWPTQWEYVTWVQLNRDAARHDRRPYPWLPSMSALRRLHGDYPASRHLRRRDGRRAAADGGPRTSNQGSPARDDDPLRPRLQVRAVPTGQARLPPRARRPQRQNRMTGVARYERHAAHRTDIETTLSDSEKAADMSEATRNVCHMNTDDKFHSARHPSDRHSDARELADALRRLDEALDAVEEDLEPLVVRRQTLGRERDQITAELGRLGHRTAKRAIPDVYRRAPRLARTRDELRDYNDQRGHRRMVFDAMASDPDRAWAPTAVFEHLTTGEAVDRRGRPIAMETLRRTMGRMAPTLLTIAGAEVSEATGHPQRVYRINPDALPGTGRPR